MPPFFKRKLILTYVFALSVIALLSLASHFTLDKMLREQKGSAAVINVAGRQRMLSQRIASLVAQSLLGDDVARTDLLVSIDELENAHHNLLRGDRELHLPPAASDPALQLIYFGGSTPLDTEVENYVARARHIALMAPARVAVSHDTTVLFRSARVQLLKDLNAIVSVHEQESERQLAFLDKVQTAMLVVVLATLFFEAIGVFLPMTRRIIHYADELHNLATTDPLTGVLNRRSLFQHGARELERAQRYNRPLALLMIDADHFKQVNDTFGHEGGDQVLIALTTTLAKGLRANDLLGRIGGEEFIILLPETDTENAELLAIRLCSSIAALKILTKKGIAALTISVGVAGKKDDPVGFSSMFDRADQAVYEAKERGRNQVVMARAA